MRFNHQFVLVIILINCIIVVSVDSVNRVAKLALSTYQPQIYQGYYQQQEAFMATMTRA